MKLLPAKISSWLTPGATATEQILDSLIEEVVILDPKGVIVEVNEAWREFARRGNVLVEEVSEGVNYLDVLRDAASGDIGVARVLRSLEAILDGSLQLFEHEYPCPNKHEIRWFSQRATPLKEPYRGAVVTHIDITDRKIAEHERDGHLMQLSRAVSAATLGQLSGAIAHELNQPLAAIMANSQAGGVMATELGLTGEINDIFEDLERSAQHARTIIERLRSILQHRPSFRDELLDINGIVEQALTLCRFELDSRGIEVGTELQPDLTCPRGDSTALEHVLLNLIVNAYEAICTSSRDTRVLTLRTAMVTEDELVITVADSGSGMPEQHRDRVFEPLFTTKQDGLGLGLSVSQSIVEAHNGQISFADAPGGGTVATVRLPVNEIAQQDRGSTSRRLGH